MSVQKKKSSVTSLNVQKKKKVIAKPKTVPTPTTTPVTTNQVSTDPVMKPTKKGIKQKVTSAPLQLTANRMAIQLLLERKYTDEQIVAQIREVFPDTKFSVSYVSTTRADLNKGYYKKEKVETPILRLIESEGKLVSADVVKKEKADLKHQKRIIAETKKKILTSMASTTVVKKKLPVKKI